MLNLPLIIKQFPFANQVRNQTCCCIYIKSFKLEIGLISDYGAHHPTFIDKCQCRYSEKYINIFCRYSVSESQTTQYLHLHLVFGAPVINRFKNLSPKHQGTFLSFARVILQYYHRPKY